MGSKKQGSKQATSGQYLTSGQRSSGMLIGSGVRMQTRAGASMGFIGDEIYTDAPAAFQLAPRTYEITADASPPSPNSTELALYLPAQLEFHEAEFGQRAKQLWIGRPNGGWNWQLSVEKQNGSLEVRLIGTPAGGTDRDRVVWRPDRPWTAFGSNRLRCETQDRRVPDLIVSAP